MTKRRKLIIILILVFAISFSVGGAYAYWAGTINAPAQKTDDISINIGEGKAINTILTINDPTFNDKLLVPPGQAGYSVVVEGKTNVEEIIVQYTVNWNAVSGSIAGALGTLKVAVTNVRIDGAGTSNYLVNVTLNNSPTYTDLKTLGATGYSLSPSIVAGTPYIVELRVTLNQASNSYEYGAIAGKPITMNVTFSLTVV